MSFFFAKVIKGPIKVKDTHNFKDIGDEASLTFAVNFVKGNFLNDRHSMF